MNTPVILLLSKKSVPGLSAEDNILIDYSRQAGNGNHKWKYILIICLRYLTKNGLDNDTNTTLNARLYTTIAIKENKFFYFLFIFIFLGGRGYVLLRQKDCIT